MPTSIAAGGVAALARYAFFEHDLFGKPASTFPDHAFFEHDLFRKPASTFRDHALGQRGNAQELGNGDG
jgi:hypothetical protein